MNTTLLLQDYKKWLFYSFDNKSFEEYYNLYKALETRKTVGTVHLIESENQDVKTYILTSNNVAEKLQISEEQRIQFLQYLINTFFHTDDIDELMKHKKMQVEIAENHAFNQPKNALPKIEKSNYKVEPHPKESLYFNIMFALSISVYALVSGVVLLRVMSNDFSSVFYLFIVLLVILFFTVINKIVTGLMVGIIRGNSVQITKEQYPDIYRIIEEQAQVLKIDLPEIYIASGHFNAFVTRLSRANILLIYSEVIETTLRDNYDILKYVTAHELCHIKQKHIQKGKYLFPARIIPLLSLAYSRGCEYTCDRVGYYFSPKGSVEGILIMTTGKEIHSKFNVEQHIQNSISNEGFWTWSSEKFLTHPHLYKRLIEIKKFSKYN